jgi:hypothetical protein
MTFCHKEKPSELKITRLIKLHTLHVDPEGYIQFSLEKDLEFTSLNSEFEIDVHMFLLETVDLVNENFSPTTNKLPQSKTRAFGKQLLGKMKDKFTQSMNRSSSFPSFRTSMSARTLNVTGRSRFEACGHFKITKNSIPDKSMLDEPQMVQVRAEEVPKSFYISEQIHFTAALTESTGNSQNSVIRENYINIFLPAIPPRWDYAYVKLFNKQLCIYKNVGDSKPIEVLSITDFTEIRAALMTECFQKHTLRLIRDPTDLSSKTLLRFENGEMMSAWLQDLQLIVNLTNSWK